MFIYKFGKLKKYIYIYKNKNNHMINRKELRELASIEMQLGLSKFPEICNLRTLDKFKEDTEKMQWRKHILMENKKFCEIILGIVFLLSLLFFYKFGFYSYIPFFINAIIIFILHKKIKNIILKIKSNLYHFAYTDIVLEKWISDIEKNGIFNHMESKEILEKRKIENFYIDNQSTFNKKRDTN